MTITLLPSPADIVVRDVGMRWSTPCQLRTGLSLNLAMIA